MASKPDLVGRLPAKMAPINSLFTTSSPTGNPAACPAETPEANARGASPRNINSIACIGLRPFRTAGFAWDCVLRFSPVAHCRSKTIMKRIGALNKRRKTEAMRLSPLLARLWTRHRSCDSDEDGPRKRVKLDILGRDGTLEFVGQPMSTARVTEMFWEARKQIANSSVSMPDRLDQESPSGLQVVPSKRRHDAWSNRNTNGRTRPLRVLECSDETTSTVKSASSARSSSALQELGLNLRDRVSQRGVPELSDILEATEPDMTLQEKSPQKPSQQNATSSLKTLSSPSRVFSAPSYDDDSSSSEFQTNVDESAAETLTVDKDATINAANMSAAEQPRPVAPTPSKWNPADAFNSSSFTPSQKADSTVNLLDFSPALSLNTPVFGNDKSKNLQNIDFGVMSPYFASHEQKPNEEGIQGNITAADARRRRSEPLPKSCLRTQGQRASLSPQKLRFADELPDTYIIHEHDGVADLDPATPSGKQAGAVHHDDAAFDTPTNTSQDLTNMTDKTPGPEHWGLQPNPESVKGKGKAPLETPVKSKGRYEINMRENPNIWGRQPMPTNFENDGSPGPSVNPAIRRLANMVDDHCGGHARVVCSQVDGRLVVRFKLPDDYAYLFPASQGADDSHFTTTPSAVSHSPRITMTGHTMTVPEGDAFSSPAVPTNLASPPMSSSLPSMPNFSVQEHEPSHLMEYSTMADQSVDAQDVSLSPAGSTKLASSPMSSSLPSMPNFSVHEYEPSHLMEHSAMETMGLSEDTVVPAPVSPRVTEEDDDIFSPLANEDVTLAVSDFGESDIPPQSSQVQTVVETPRITAAGSSSPAMDVDNTTTRNLYTTPTKTTATEDVEKSASASKKASLSSTSELTELASLTPVKSLDLSPVGPDTQQDEQQTTPQIETPVKETTESLHTCTHPAVKDDSPQPGSFTLVTKTTPPTAAASGQTSPPAIKTETNTSPAAMSAIKEMTRSRRREESLDRDYLTSFVDRYREQSKQPSTTEAGSPVPPATKRQPLGAKSPNTASPQKAKRKLEEFDDEAASPVKRIREPSPKKARREGGEKKSRRVAEAKPPTVPAEAAAEFGDEIEGQSGQPHAAEEPEPATRRSSRIRGQASAPAGPKSSIPTPIKIGQTGRGGSRGAKSSAPDSVGKTTSTNTRFNRGDEPQLVLARIAEGVLEQSSEKAPLEVEPTVPKGGRNVEWRNPLASYQDDKGDAKTADKAPEKSTDKATDKKAETASKLKPKSKSTTKTTKTLGSTGVTKKKAPSSSTPLKTRPGRVAEGLGMTGNGTPARPQRVTRSRAKKAT